MNSFLSASSFTSNSSWPNSFNIDQFPTFKKWGLSVYDHVIPHHRNNYHPHALSHRMIALVSILAIAIKVASVSLVVFSPAASIQAVEITQSSVVNLTNQARSQNGLAALNTNSLLTKAAQNKANDMLARQYFAHNTPDGATPWSFIKSAGYSYTTAGENLAIDFLAAESVQAAWMNSPGHKANIVNPAFKEIGIGIAKGVYDNHNTIIVVQMFGAPVAQQVEVKAEPTPVAPQAVQPTSTAPTSQAIPAPQAPSPASPVNQADFNVLGPAQPSEPIKIVETKTSLQGDKLYIEVTASSNVVKLLAFYGSKSVMLDSIGDNIWQGKVPVSSLGEFDNLLIQAQDINGSLHQEPLAQFSNDLLAGDVNGESVTVFGAEVNPSAWEEKVFLVILGLLIIGLIVAIGVKRHVQHLSLIANTSFAAMLIAMLMLV